MLDGLAEIKEAVSVLDAALVLDRPDEEAAALADATID